MHPESVAAKGCFVPQSNLYRSRNEEEEEGLHYHPLVTHWGVFLSVPATLSSVGPEFLVSRRWGRRPSLPLHAGSFI